MKQYEETKRKYTKNDDSLCWIFLLVFWGLVFSWGGFIACSIALYRWLIL